ncbi:hypothetical protein [Phaffia rhodozyma]|uniref:Uncharacterized protein n=1 Tax=Phaffia rhodozyma TaxID=264483 RepID=A0A0F7SI72_PHARH|nr:hypothetical protein [Phaffia rhodozyma]
MLFVLALWDIGWTSDMSKPPRMGEWGDVGEREHTEAAEPGGELDDGSVGVESTGRVPDEENRLVFVGGAAGSSGRIDGEARDRAGSGGWAVSG